mmetsp:Transcript_25490/g.28589  ORF Transcript_25490/g.28589 Transcript_25490/m.28589 type:complete len:141 (+) Transcript_25490:174-596(+)
MSIPPRKYVKLQSKTPGKTVIPKVSPDNIVDDHSGVKGTVVQSSNSDVNFNDMDVDGDDDVDDKDVVDKEVDNEQKQSSKTDSNINVMDEDVDDDSENEDDKDAQKLKDLYKWIAPAPRVVDMSHEDMRLGSSYVLQCVA